MGRCRLRDPAERFRLWRSPYRRINSPGKSKKVLSVRDNEEEESVRVVERITVVVAVLAWEAE